MPARTVITGNKMKYIEQFNNSSADYFKFRPGYPKELFKWINENSLEHNIAVDCGTGNGQAAHELAPYFEKIIAIDLNVNQIKEAKSDTKIEYRVMSAENMDVEDNSVDLIVSASAAHWFNLEKFYAECKRVLKNTGLIVLWTYSWPTISNNSDLNGKLQEIKNNLNPFWGEESLLHLNHYRDLPFPFKQRETPDFSFSYEWDLEQLVNFFSTWACIKEHLKINPDFLQHMKDEMNFLWPADSLRVKFDFDIYLKAGSL